MICEKDKDLMFEFIKLRESKLYNILDINISEDEFDYNSNYKNKLNKRYLVKCLLLEDISDSEYSPSLEKTCSVDYEIFQNFKKSKNDLIWLD
jgi:hypothetical protein